MKLGILRLRCEVKKIKMEVSVSQEGYKTISETLIVEEKMTGLGEHSGSVSGSRAVLFMPAVSPALLTRGTAFEKAAEQMERKI